VVVDYLTKWVELEALLPTEKANVVTTFFVNRVVLRHGLPETMISDRGKCFLANLTQSTLHKLGVKHKTTSSYHPQTNGQVERMNHTLAMMISMYVAEDQKDWDEQLPYICFAYNTSRQDTTGFSPFFLLYGREAILPIDVFLGAQPNPWIDVPQANVPYADRLLNDLHEARNLVRIRIQRAQEKQKQIYDAQHHDVSFQKGDVVLVYNPIRKKGKIRQTTPSLDWT
jgi:transposase InsO family protein